MPIEIIDHGSSPATHPPDEAGEAVVRLDRVSGTNNTLNKTTLPSTESARQVAERLREIFARPGLPGISENRPDRESLHGDMARRG